MLTFAFDKVTTEIKVESKAQLENVHSTWSKNKMKTGELG